MTFFQVLQCRLRATGRRRANPSCGEATPRPAPRGSEKSPSSPLSSLPRGSYHSGISDLGRGRGDACEPTTASLALTLGALLSDTMNGASEHRTTARPPPNLQLAGTRQNTFDAHLGFSAQRNGKFGRTRLIALRPMARKAPARACRSSPSGCCLFLSSPLVSRRCCFYAPFVSLRLLSRRCTRAATGSAGRHDRVAAGSKPNTRARPTDRLTERRPAGRPAA